MPSERRVKISRSAQVATQVNLIQSYRFTLTASEANLMDNEIFVLREFVINNTTGETSTIFDHVATPVELDTLPIGEPSEGETTYRSSYVELNFDTEAEADDAWEAIQNDVGLLVRALDLGDRLGLSEDIWFGDEP